MFPGNISVIIRIPGLIKYMSKSCSIVRDFAGLRTVHYCAVWQNWVVPIISLWMLSNYHVKLAQVTLLNKRIRNLWQHFNPRLALTGFWMTGPWPINALQYNDNSMSTETDCGKIPHLYMPPKWANYGHCWIDRCIERFSIECWK